MRTIVVLPAYNAAATLQKTIDDIPFEYVDELILVDDASRDSTVDTMQAIVRAHPKLALAKDEPQDGTVLCSIIRHDANLGYGGNQKTCYNTALAHGADIVVMVHPDYQYDPKLVKYFVEFIRDGYFSVMLGSRIRSRAEALAGGMPAYKYYANRLLTFLQNIASGRALGEWHTGMRAYHRLVLEHVPYENFSDDFIFDTQMLFSIVEHGYAMGDIPVPVRYFKEASSINFARSCRYGLLTLAETVKFMYRQNAQIVRYAVVGMTSLFANLFLYTILLHELHWWYLGASIASFIVGGVVSFTLHKFWTFKQQRLKYIVRELPRYVVAVGINLALTAALVFLLVSDFSVPAWTANVVANICVAIWGFFVFKYIVFRTKIPAHTFD